MMEVLGVIEAMLLVLRDCLSNFCGTVLVANSLSWLPVGITLGKNNREPKTKLN
jgi:hypothetical protein